MYVPYLLRHTSDNGTSVLTHSIVASVSVNMVAQLSFSRVRFQLFQVDAQKEKCCVTSNIVFSFWSKPSP